MSIKSSYQSLVKLFFVVLLVWLSASPASIAVDYALPTAQANVVLDGRPLFPLEQSGKYTAQQRARQVNRQLAQLARLKNMISVQVIERNQQQTITANDQYLLTVTDSDLLLNENSQEQAREWARQLTDALQTAQKERTKPYFHRAARLTGLVLLVALLIHWGLGRLWHRPLRRAFRQVIPHIATTGMPGAKDFKLMMGLKLTLLRLAVWLGALNYVASLFPLLRQYRYDLFNSSVTSIQAPLFSSGDRAYTLFDLLILLGLLWGLVALIQASAQLLKQQILKRTRLERGAQEIVANLYRYTSLLIGTLVLLQAWGVNVRSLALLASALGIGIGFGFQDIVRNFGSGLVLLVERSVQVGDFVELESYMGVVERIGARSITLLTPDNLSVIVPNAQVVEAQVVNWNHEHPVSRLCIKIGTDYETDLTVAKSALLQAAQEQSDVLPKPAPDVFLKRFGDSAIEFELLVWIRSPEQQFRISSELYFRIGEIFKQQSISIPYPQRDIHLRNAQLPVTFSDEVTAALTQALNGIGKKNDIVNNNHR